MNGRTNLNPDQAFVRNMRRRIKRQNGYCPCKLRKTPENKCPCRDYRECGVCECGLYLRKESNEDVRLH